MSNYLMLNIAFMLIALGIIAWCQPRHKPRRIIVILAIMLTLTAVFDPLIIHFGIVKYYDNALLGFKVFGAPIEDFAYALTAACLMPALWQKYNVHRER